MNPPPDDPALPLLSVMPKWLVVTLAVIAFVVPTVLLVVTLAVPTTIEALRSLWLRYVFCILISLYLAVFFFVLYPQKVVVKTWVKLVGPLALWVFFFQFLSANMPSPRTGTLFRPRYAEGAPKLRASSLTIEPVEGGKSFPCFYVPDSNGDLEGVYIEFLEGEDAYPADLKRGQTTLGKCTFEVDGDHFIVPDIVSGPR